jgi:aerobic-type carbon monoxide dehydrogenase small subunit (CoxS/CutS family)
VPISLQVNGEPHELDVPPTRRLLTVLREDLALTGAKHGCGEGACGACAVLLDGRPIASCLFPVAAAEGREVTTVEGLAETAASLQEAFVAEDALQCGFCTPGQIVSATALLASTARPTRDEIRATMAGNLCRCGTYPKIERAILRVSGQEIAS